MLKFIKGKEKPSKKTVTKPKKTTKVLTAEGWKRKQKKKNK
jgi:hypothetical protein